MSGKPRRAGRFVCGRDLFEELKELFWVLKRSIRGCGCMAVAQYAMENSRKSRRRLPNMVVTVQGWVNQG